MTNPAAADRPLQPKASVLYLTRHFRAGLQVVASLRDWGYANAANETMMAKIADSFSVRIGNAGQVVSLILIS